MEGSAGVRALNSWSSRAFYAPVDKKEGTRHSRLFFTALGETLSGGSGESKG